MKDSVIGSDGGDLSISGIAAYQPSDGLMEFKVVKFYTFIHFKQKNGEEFTFLYCCKWCYIGFGSK